MKKFSFHHFPRDFEAGDFIENFLVSGVVNVLFWRFFLKATNYPKITLASFYFPHVLTGGLLMMIALFILFVYLNKEAKFIASIIGGAGFGIFIDEIGKYITQDNNYFYQPAIAIIYVIFVVIFLVTRTMEKKFKPGGQEYLINALEAVKQAAMHDLDTEEKKRALYLLKFADKGDEISEMLERLLKEIRAKPIEKPSIFHKLRNYFNTLYKKLISYKYFTWSIVMFFIVASIANFFGALFSFANIEDFADWGQLIFSIISGFLVLLGTLFFIYKSSRKIAYQMFKYAVLISIFLTQFFRFLENQLSAITVLLLSLVVLSVLQYLIYEESLIKETD